MNQSRIKKGVRNVIVSILLYVGLSIVQFVNRTIFISFLPTEYLGLNGLFKNILSFLALSELGIGSAMSFALYKPLSEQNQEMVKSIMNLYKKLYCMVGIVILCIGGLLTPFLSYLIKEVPKDMTYIWVYYLLYLLNSGVSYFYTYKRTIIICDQKQYISSLTSIGSQIFLSIFQVIILFFTHCYFLYLLAMVIITILENLLISYIADCQYPYLKEKKAVKLDKKTVKSIQKNIFAMLFHKIGGIVVLSSDNLIISKFVGLGAVGFYSNYTLIVNCVSNLISQFFSALVASVGNLVATETENHTKKVFCKILFANFWLFGFASICLFCLLEPFIVLWLGRNYLLGIATVLIIAINFYLQGMRKSVLMFKDASGVFWQDRYKPLFESIINIIVSIPLAISLGVKGVLIGTIISTISVPFWFEGYVLYKYTFHDNIKRYIILQVQYMMITYIAGTITYSCIHFIFLDGVIGFIIKLLICVFIPNLVFLVVYRKKEECRYYLEIAKRMILK